MPGSAKQQRGAGVLRHLEQHLQEVRELEGSRLQTGPGPEFVV